ncbi:glycoside hydrolase family 2 protein, partial [Kutzneria kofuensis]
MLTPVGAAPVTAAVNRQRTVSDFDAGWLFHYGDASGANATTYPDSDWRKVSVPHDWSIEGPNPPANPFAKSAPSTGHGGYLPSGISLYRRHLSLAGIPGTRKVFVEFDGVMADASVYVNGKLIGTHPYGYTSFRYDNTAVANLGADNVIAVKTDTSQQPASRYYTGAGIYRDVRLIATDPVHVDQWATYVTTPNATGVHAQTTVVNSGSSVASVSVLGVLSLATNVIVGGTAVDDDITPVGIRTLTFSPSAGMKLNGKSVKFQGVALHQDFHGLGMAAPQRAVQRRLAELKALGVNAIRTAHDPPSPAFLELTDRMG